MNKFEISKEPINEVLRKQLIDYAYPIIGCMHYVHENLGPGLPEYCYQEALTITLKEKGFEVMKECKHHIVFNNQIMESFINSFIWFTSNSNLIGNTFFIFNLFNCSHV